ARRPRRRPPDPAGQRRVALAPGEAVMSYATGRRRFNRRGTALLMAVLMISIVGGSLAALTLAFAAQAKRTTRQAQDAQLRQLLLAGQVAAQQSIGQSKSGEVALPADLRSAGGSVRYET